MRVVQSVPDVDTLIKALESALKDNADSFAQEAQMSTYTYNRAMDSYNQAGRAKLAAYIEEHGVKLCDDRGGIFPEWTRFEDAHLPRLSDHCLREPARLDIDSPVYTVFCPKDLYMKADSKIKLFTGFRLLLKKNQVALVTLHASLTAAINLCSSGIIVSSNEELSVVLEMLDPDGVAAGQPLLDIVILTVDKLDTDKFVPRTKKEDQITDDKVFSDVTESAN